MATISVIIPTYNSQDTILETIESVQNQTFSDFEIVVINDGSTDLTLEILNAIKDERIQIYSYENGGVSLARNRGISHAKGEYIAFMDADDLWTADKLELQLIALQNNSQAALAYSWTYIMSEDGKQAHKCAPVIIEGN
ncbi:MAG: glycosyltransferase family 2 protein, partial [Rivularia sp. ALOHA_DT_140]|nr:glycosyltransferase family 2 protein [Rivularia sp. ALOHA_DT_140]